MGPCEEWLTTMCNSTLVYIFLKQHISNGSIIHGLVINLTLSVIWLALAGQASHTRPSIQLPLLYKFQEIKIDIT